MKECVYPGFRVRFWHIGYPVYHPAGTTGCGNLSGIEHIEGECVVRLVSGTITDSEAQPVKNIQVSVKLNANPQAGKVPVAVSAENGTYERELEGIFPVQTATLYADDTTGVYATDSAVVELRYDKSQVSKSNHWNNGTATVIQDFQLKKK